MSELLIRRMAHTDLRRALELTQAQRWSHRLKDWEFHFRLGRGWVACDAGGMVVGTALWWAYGEHHGTVGLVVVAPDFQGQGIGRRLFDTVLQDAQSRGLQLIATEAGLKLYRQAGFREQGFIAQRQGVADLKAAAPTAAVADLRPVHANDLPSLVTLDAAAFGASRSEAIRAVFDARIGGVVADIAGETAGFCLSRLSGKGVVIGPVVARDENLAKALIAQQLQTIDGFVRLDVPTDAADLSAWLEEVGLKSVDRVTIMVRGEPPSLNTHAAQAQTGRVFGLISQALS